MVASLRGNQLGGGGVGKPLVGWVRGGGPEGWGGRAFKSFWCLPLSFRLCGTTTRQQTLPIAAAHCCKKILHNLDILLCAHRNLSISFRIGSRGVGNSARTDAKLLLHDRSLIVAMKGYDLPILKVKNIARRDIYCLARGS